MCALGNRTGCKLHGQAVLRNAVLRNVRTENGHCFPGLDEQWQRELDIIRERALRNRDEALLRECAEAQEEIDLLHKPSVRLFHGSRPGTVVWLD